VPDGVVNIVIHLDAVKFREVEHRFTDSEIDDWHSWAVAVARAILQDEEHLPTLNPRCGTCPIRHDCSAFLEMPQTAALVVAAQPAEAAARVQWREEANRLRLTLEKAVKQIDAEFAAAAMESGGMVLGGFQWEVQMDIRTEFDLPGLFAVLGSDRFYRAVTTSKAAIERVTKDADLSTVAAAQSMISETAVGTKVVRRKAGR